jgi:hypothetical protein
MQVTIKSAANDKTCTIEFRLGEGSDAPSEEQLIEWMESGKEVRVVCTTVAARPWVHQEGKQYRTQGSPKEINGVMVALDTIIVFSGQSIALASDPLNLEEDISKARGAYKRSQRDFRKRLNADRIAKTHTELPDRIAKMRESRAKQATQNGETSEEGSAPASGSVRRNNR